MKYFNIKEFFTEQEDEYYDMLANKADPAWFIDPRLKTAVDKIRAAAGVPVTINSGWRSLGKNIAVHTDGGGKYSQHQYGRAADIQCSLPDEKMLEIIRSIPEIKGLGIGKGWFHVDVRDSEERFEWRY
jgi:uncharacterized protein YcbK (DUF882 family)